MTATRIRRAALPLGLAGTIALAAFAASGSSATAKQSPDRFAEQAQTALAKGQVEKAITLAEAVVAAAPREPAYRALLGQAYLKAGRFNSAATTFDDAMKLGDNSARTALGLALANAAAGRNAQAVAVLDDWRDAIPASDLGLALALSGETSRGVAILADALRGGDNSAKLRQNLAYAYALDGRWRESRVMMEQDVSADQIDARVSAWARTARPEDYQLRIATLLRAPLRADPGQPSQLALNASPASEQLAAEASAAAATPVKPVATVAVKGELPPVDEAPTAAPVTESSATLAEYAPVTTVALPPAQAEAAPAAAAAPVPDRPTFAQTFVSEPVIQAIPAARSAPVRSAPVRAATVRTAAAPVAAPAFAKGSSHAVQLGSFASQQGARRAWGIFAAKNPELKNYRMTITPAVVRGKNFWRVAAAGFEAKGASGMCSRVKSRGGVCFAYTVLPARAGALAKAAPAKAPAKALAKAAPAPVRKATAPTLVRR